MRLTRLHLILILFLTVVVMLHFSQKTLVKSAKPLETPPPAAEEKKAEAPPAPSPEITARNTIAIAGEFWKIARKENRDIAAGQATLRLAKETFVAGDYEKAVELARKSIKELKESPVIIQKTYTVRRNDCLWNIAKMKIHYGRGSMWVKIWRANEKKIPDFDVIYRGQVIAIPGI